MKLLNFTIIKLTLCLILGIGIAYNFDINLDESLISGIILLSGFGIAMLLTKNNYSDTIWPGILIFTTTIAIGIFTVKVNEQLNFKDHYTKHHSVISDTSYLINFRIREILRPGNYHNKYVVEILKINNEIVSGKALVNIQIDTAYAPLKVDDILITKSTFLSLPSLLNPHQFDYKNYLRKKYIYHQITVANAGILRLRSKEHTLFGYANILRERINNNLEAYQFKPDEIAIIKALLLGQRQDISKDMYSRYADAGAVHILAVSGLHVGIILLLLNYLFNPLAYFKYGKTLKIIVIVLLLWAFAIIAGLSASVVRAVTMFTVIAIAMNLKRPTNIFNTLAISMFILLLIKPMFLFDVGFQLSYLAVLTIVTLHPMLYKLWQPKLKILDFFWNILCVTIAAQVGVLPVSLYYFHQLPGLFFVSNLVIIPALGFILGFGILIIILSLLNALPSVLADIYGSIISLMNTIVNWISRQENFLFKDISFGLTYVIISYLLIILILSGIKKGTYKSVALALIAVLCCQGFLIFEKIKDPSNAFIVFHKSRYSIIGIKHDRHLILHHNLNDTVLQNDKVIRDFKVGEGLIDTRTDSIQYIYRCKGKAILVVDSLGIFNIKSFKPDIILLRNSPKVNLKRLIDSLGPELIISDGSNYKSYQERWARTCRVQEIPFHQTGKKGAYIYSY